MDTRHAPPPGTVVVWSDLTCPWAHVAVARLHRVREELGLGDDVRLDHRAVPLELLNRRPTPKPLLDAERPVAAALEPGAGWRPWDRPDWQHPVTALPALEAVQAAKQQSLRAGEALDLALRRAFFGESRCISLRSVVLDVAEACAEVDAAALAAALDDGRCRAALMEMAAEAASDRVKGSPHLFLPDGTDAHNPGVRLREAEHEHAAPVVESDDPGVYGDLLRRVALPAGA